MKILISCLLPLSNVAYIDYGLTKTAAEEMSEHATDTVMDLIKYHVNEYDNNVTNHERNTFNEKRSYVFDVSPKEYYYVDELSNFFIINIIDS